MTLTYLKLTSTLPTLSTLNLKGVERIPSIGGIGRPKEEMSLSHSYFGSGPEGDCQGANTSLDNVQLNRSESGKTAADISRDHFWAHYSKHAETMKRREEEVKELLAKDPFHFARRPSESAGVRFGTFTDVDIHVQQRMSEFDKGDNDGSKERGEDAPPSRNLWLEAFDRNQAASRIQAWWRRLHGYTYKKEEDKLKPARSLRRGLQRRETMSNLSGFSKVASAQDSPLLRRTASVQVDQEGQRNSRTVARNLSLPRQAISLKVNKEEQSSPPDLKGPPPPLRRVASTNLGLDGSFRRRGSSVNPVLSEDGQQRELRRRSSVNPVSSEDGQQQELRQRSSIILWTEDGQLDDDDDVSPWCNPEMRLEHEPRDSLLQQQELRRWSRINRPSDEGLQLRRRNSTNAPSEEDGMKLCRRSSTNAPSEEDGMKLRRRCSTNVQSEEDAMKLRRRSSTNVPSEEDAMKLRRRSSTNALSEEDVMKLRRRSSTNFSPEAAPQLKSQQQSRRGSRQGEGEADGRGTIASLRRCSVGSDASSDPRWIIKKDASYAVSKASSEAGSADCGSPSQDEPEGGVLYHQRLYRQQQQNRLADLGKPQSSVPFQTPTASRLKLDPGASPCSSRMGGLSQEMEVPKAPFLCSGIKVQARRRSVTFACSEADDHNNSNRRLSNSSCGSAHLHPELKPISSSPLSKSAGQLEDLLTRSGLCVSLPGSPLSGHPDMDPAADMHVGSMASRKRSGSNRLRLLKSRPGFATGSKREPRRSISFRNYLHMENGPRGKCSSSMEDRASCPIPSPRERSSSSCVRTLPPAEHACHAAADAASGTSLASRTYSSASLRTLPDIHPHHSTASTALSFNSSTDSLLHRHSVSNVIPNPFKDFQLSSASDVPPHSGMPSGRQSRSSGALQPTRLQSMWPTSMQG